MIRLVGYAKIQYTQAYPFTPTQIYLSK